MKLFNRGTEFYLTMVSLLLLLFVAACGQQRDVLPATEEEQIKNVALDYFYARFRGATPMKPQSKRWLTIGRASHYHQLSLTLPANH
ncbi:MAG: hypothetical protein R2932_51585 [Caldilineaceae bacterium]